MLAFSQNVCQKNKTKKNVRNSDILTFFNSIKTVFIQLLQQASDNLKVPLSFQFVDAFLYQLEFL